jgi:hypothetical protein
MFVARKSKKHGIFKVANFSHDRMYKKKPNRPELFKTWTLKDLDIHNYTISKDID